MGNQQSNTGSEDLSSGEQYRGSRTMANSNILGDRSGNTRSNNTINSGNIVTINYDGGHTGSSEDSAKILQCLYTSKYEEHRGRVSDPVEGTCTWVTEHPKYKDWWEKEESGLLWLSADPGCGKSVTASFLINHLQSKTDDMVCYFFFKDDSDEQRRATFALCAILHQLFMQNDSLCRYAEGALKGKGKEFTEEVDTLWDILVGAVAEGVCGNVICVVDALDECEEESRARLMRHVTWLAGSQTSQGHLKFIVTSRPYHNIERQLGSPATTIRLKGEEEVPAISADVIRVIDKGIEDLELLWEQPGGLGYLRNLLVSLADRTFLWVSLVLEILKNSEDGSREVFTNIVSTAPPDIGELYSKILDKSKDHGKVRRILHIVVAAARPLTLREMNVAFRIRREHKSCQDIGDLAGFGKTVKNLCGLFVRVIDSKIYLVHQTAREFLLHGSLPGVGNWQHTICPQDSNFTLADICIIYLSLEDFEDDPLVVDTHGYCAKVEVDEYVKNRDFLDYAARNWADHFRDSRDQQMRLFESTQLICKPGSNRFLTWFQVHWVTSGQWGKCPADFTHLMVATWLGHGAAVQRLLGEGGYTNARCEGYGTALNIAAVREDEDITKMMLEKNVKAYIGRKEYNILHTKRSELENYMDMMFSMRMRWIEFLMRFCIQDTPDLHNFHSRSTAFS